jgi:hypothetical protein
MDEIQAATSQQKKIKAAGPDGPQAEACSYVRLHAHLSILFIFLFKRCYVPDRFVQSIIVPLVKGKVGDLTDVNNHRAIMLSNTVTKIMASALINKITTYILIVKPIYLALRKITQLHIVPTC